MNKQTPAKRKFLPLDLKKHPKERLLELKDASDNPITTFDYGQLILADLICRSVNSHHKLLNMLKSLEWSGYQQGQGSGYMSSGGDGRHHPACPSCDGLKPTKSASSTAAMNSEPVQLWKSGPGQTKRSSSYGTALSTK